MHRDRVAIVTGGGSGIGLAACRRLSADGFALAVFDLDPGRASTELDDDHLVLELDVASAGDVDGAVTRTLEHFGRVDVLVNNAGIAGSDQATVCHETPVGEWDRVLAVNARGAFLCTRAVLPTMLEAEQGHVITVASVAGQQPFPGRCAYTASKGAALQLARSVAVDYAEAGIRSNAVCPGMTRTPMTQWRLDQPRLREAVERRIPLGRVASPEQIADAISVLASSRLDYMTGQALVVDGGWSIG